MHFVARPSGPKTTSEITREEGVMVGLATEMIEEAERDGDVCRTKYACVEPSIHQRPKGSDAPVFQVATSIPTSSMGPPTPRLFGTHLPQ